MTVQELIDKLNKIEDKSKIVLMQQPSGYFGGKNFEYIKEVVDHDEYFVDLLKP